MIPTPHIEVKEQGVIAKTVLMPGDPLRAKYIAETYLTDITEFNTVRGMLGYTGTYRGHLLSVMGSGMGMPSIGIYSYELFAFYQVENIIRVGSCGAYSPELKLFDLVLASEAFSESTFALAQNGNTANCLASNPLINQIMIETAKSLDFPLTIGRIHSSDVFYHATAVHEKHYNTNKCLAVEMESFALFHNANVLGKKAACLLTVSDSLVTHQATTANQRQTAFNQMMELALETAIKL